MGMDQYIYAVNKASGEQFLLAQYRKNYHLHKYICNQADVNPNTPDCFIRIPLTETLLENSLDIPDLLFVLRNMDINSDYANPDDWDDFSRICKYDYFYEANW